jgi:hypothetical protein
VNHGSSAPALAQPSRLSPSLAPLAS